jgi:hypothetical protein
MIMSFARSTIFTVAESVPHREIAGLQPPVDEGRGGQIRTLPIAGRHRGASHLDFADFDAVAVGFFAIFTDDAKVDAEKRPSGSSAATRNAPPPATEAPRESVATALRISGLVSVIP